jgi:Metallo-beta-lactamase superfamily
VASLSGWFLFITNLILSCGEATSQAFYIILTPIFLKLRGRSSFGDDTPPPPTVEITNPRRIADGVWIIPDYRIWLVPNIGVVLGKDAALVIDTGLGPANGEKVLELARSIGGKRRLLLTVTHFHPEHGYGAQVFRPDVMRFAKRYEYRHG